MHYNQYKRFLDVLSAGFLGIILLPIILAAALLIILIDWHAPFFRQLRPGKDQRLFVCYKLRTMRSGTEPDEKRLTLLGRLLRKTAIDELPQLWNVLSGEMSIVGPRPLLPEYLPLYSDHQKRRHEVRPGITGLAQLKRDQGLTWQARLDLDVFYVDHYSFRMDLNILLKTMLVLLTGLVQRKPTLPTGKFKGEHS